MVKNATFFGGAINDTTTKEYLEAEATGKYLAELGYNIKTGGYHGLMEAVSMGASDAKKGVGIFGYTCKTFGYTRGNYYLTDCTVCDDIYDRLRCLITDTDVFIIQAGGVGTLVELSLVLDEFRKTKKTPEIYVFGETWEKVLNEMKPILGEKVFGLITFIKSVDHLKLHLN